MGEEHKTPEQVDDEDFKVAPTCADEERLNKKRTTRENNETTGENYDISSLKKSSAEDKKRQ